MKKHCKDIYTYNSRVVSLPGTRDPVIHDLDERVKEIMDQKLQQSKAQLGAIIMEKNQVRESHQMQDSNERQEFATGAVRDLAEDKPRLDLISPFFEDRLGHWLRLGAEKYDERNWEKGIPFSRCIAAIKRHTMRYQMGMTDEDHLAAIACNAMFLIHYEEMIKLCKLPSELDDIPGYCKPKTGYCKPKNET